MIDEKLAAQVHVLKIACSGVIPKRANRDISFCVTCARAMLRGARL